MTKRISKHPDFEASLRLLVESERYSLIDIGAMFDMTGEAIRLWCVKYRIIHPDNIATRGMNAYRKWDDSQNRFVPINRGMLNREVRKEKAANRKKEMELNIEERRKRIVSSAALLKASLGRDPTTIEIANAVIGRKPDYHAPAFLLKLWGGPVTSTKEKYAELMSALRAAGVDIRNSGWRSRMNNKAK